MLKIADPNKEFVVCTDAYNRGLGGSLVQDGKVVCYESRKLNEHEKKYPIHDIELVVIMHALKMWRHYLLAKRFVFLIHHNWLRYLDQPNLNGK